MSRIRSLRGGIWYRPEDTPAGPAGWCADIYWMERWGRRWIQRQRHYGPCATKEEIQTVFNPEWQKILEKSYK